MPRQQSRSMILLYIMAVAVIAAETTASAAAAAASRKHHLMTRGNGAPLRQSREIRGGSSERIPTDKDEEIDAYIDRLVATVPDSGDEAPETTTDDDEQEASDHAVRAVTATVTGTSNGKDDNDEEEEDFETEDENQTAELPKQAVIAAKQQALTAEPTPVEPTNKELTTVTMEEEIPLAASSASKKTKQKKKQRKRKPVTTTASTAKVPDPVPAIPAVASADESSALSSTSTAAQQVEPSKTPNGLYRFLLRSGRVGHIMVLCMIVTLEWIQLYLPPLYSLLAALYVRLAPNFIQNPPPPVVYKPKAKSSLSRRSLAKHADALAFQQLRKIGNVSAAKYRYCSQAFLKRHGLGAYKSAAANRRGEDPELISVVSKVLEGKKQQSAVTGKGGSVTSVDDDDDNVGWIVQALTMELPGVADRASVSTATFFDDDGMELSSADKRRQSIQQALRQMETSNSKSRLGPAAIKPTRTISDRDSGMLGRIRAGVGSNTMSRSLFGAYPGDAVPISEAANPKGVIELAKRYGYGDWSDDDDSDDDGVGGRRGKSLYDVDHTSQRQEGRKTTRASPRKRRRKKKKRQDPSIKFEFGFNVGGGQGSSSTTERTRLTPRARHERTSSSSNTMGAWGQREKEPSYLTPVERQRAAGCSPRLADVDALVIRGQKRTRASDVPIRPAMSRLNELRSKPKETPFRPLMDRRNELRNKKDGDS